MQKVWGVLAAIIIVVITYIGVYAILPNDKDELSIARSRITAISNPTSGSKNDDHTVHFTVPVGTVFTGTNTEIYSKLAALLPECNSNRMRTVTRQAETGAVEKTK